MERFAISNVEMASLDTEDFKIAKMKDWYITRLLKFANELGLQGKKITDVYRIDEQFSNMQTYIDFKVETPTRRGR